MRVAFGKSKRVNIARAAYMVLPSVLLALLCWFDVHALIGYPVCMVLFGLVQLRVVFLSRGDRAYQEKHCKRIGVLLLPPAAGMIVQGVALLFLADATIPNAAAYGAIAVSAIMAAGVCAHRFMFRADASLAAKFLRYADCAALSAPISLAVTLALSLSGDESAEAIGCMSAILLGVMGVLIAVNLMLTSAYGHIGTRASVKQISALISSKKLTISRVMLVKDGLFVAGKLLIGLASLSFFMFANGLYSVGIGVGRYIAIEMHSRSNAEQRKSYRKVGGVILFSSICYVLYSTRLFFGGKSTAYPMVIAIAIALYTFVEFGINIQAVIRLRKSKALAAKALRALSLASTLLCFVLTQTALMSFAHEGDANFLNALSGVLFGGAAALIGLHLLIGKTA